MTDPECILSVTSWKGRIYDRNVPAILWAFTQQKTSYRYKVVLVLSEDEFPGKVKDIPAEISTLTDILDNFEILWTKRNTRALKKLNPVMKAYPDIPVMTTDDDCILVPDAVQRAMDQHKAMPRAILSVGLWEFHHPLQQVTYGFRLYPPHSLYDLDDELFMKYFGGYEDDIWNAIRARLAGTESRSFTGKILSEEAKIGPAFRDTYLKYDPKAFYDAFTRDISVFHRH